MGKTGAYLHFVRLLHRMLLKLQRVDVYDNAHFAPPASPTPTHSPAKRPRLDSSTGAWPDYSAVAKLPFTYDTREHKYANTSPLVSDSATRTDALAEKNRKWVPGSARRRCTRSVLLSPWSAFDIYHHCDSCKQYREGTGPSSSLCHAFKLRSGEVLQFVIPSSCQRHFTFTQDKQLRSLRLPLVLSGGSGESVKSLKRESGEEFEGEIRTPIMMPSTGRHETGNDCSSLFAPG